MGKTTTYPDGSQLVSSALTKDQCEQALQIATAILLGYTVDPFVLPFFFQHGSNIAQIFSTLFLYAGQSVVSPALPANSKIIAVGPANTVAFTTVAIQSGLRDVTISDPNTPSYVRIGWQQQGQPGPLIGNDTTFVKAQPIDSEYSRLHDRQRLPTDDPLMVNKQDIFTRRWEVTWTVYGPNSLDMARAIHSGLIGIPYVEDLLNTSNLYVDPDIKEPLRVPELFQGQWWERVDIVAEFNEQITESYVVGTVGSVEVKVYDKSGEIYDTTVS